MNKSKALNTTLNLAPLHSKYQRHHNPHPKIEPKLDISSTLQKTQLYPQALYHLERRPRN